MHEESAHRLRAYLYSLYDLIFLTMMDIGSLFVGVFAIGDLVSPAISLRWLLALLGIVIAVSIHFSPKILNEKSGSRSITAEKDKRLPMALALSGLVPGLGLFAAALLTNSGKVDVVPVFVFLYSVLSGAMMMLPYLIFAYFEAILLAWNSWPRIANSE